MRSLTARSYERAKAVFIDLCREAGVAEEFVGFFGSVTSPGVSDLDALVVGASDQIRRISDGMDRLRRTDAELREIFWHPPVYVLESVKESAGALHTLYGLPSGLRTILGCSATEADSSYARTLEQVWFSFLVSVVVGSLTKRQISVRLVLLLHKNFEVSYDKFSRLTGGGEHGSMRSEHLRQDILGGGAPEEALRALRDLVEGALGLQDEIGVWPYGVSRDKRFVRLSPRVMARSSRSSRIIVLRGVGLVSLCAGAFEPIRRLVADEPGNDALSEYLSVARRVAKEYRRFGLRYPFITPGNRSLKIS